YPYEWLLEENARRRGSPAMEFELIDTGIFDEDKYFDVEIEYAKADADDVLMLTTVHNRGAETSSIHGLPQVWFRNIWSWSEGVTRPRLKDQGAGLVRAEHEKLGVYAIAFETPDRLLFCDNETNFARLFGVSGAQGYCKDAFHEYVIHGRVEAVNPAGEGTKAGGTLCPRHSPLRQHHDPSSAARGRAAHGSLGRLRQDGAAAEGRGRRLLRRSAAGH